MKKKLSLLLAMLLLAGNIGACGADTPDTPDSDPTSDTGETTPAETEPADPYAGIDLGGYTIRMLISGSRIWNTMSMLNVEEQTGESFNDAIWNRNIMIEDKLKMKFEITEIEDIQSELNKVVNANEDAYDAAFTSTNLMASNIAAGYYQNLLDMDALQLDKPWWDPNFNETLVLENQYLYQASTPLNLMAFDMTVACYFNTDLFEHNNFESPYDLVRDGSWTFDKMNEYIRKGANLNGDPDWYTNNAAVYGLSTFNGWTGVLATIAAPVVDKDEEGLPYFAGATEKLYNMLDKMHSVFSPDGHAVGNSADYDKYFLNGKSLFCLISIGNASVFRQMDQAYGILPVPKHEVTDEYSSPMGTAYILGVPVTTPNTDKVGTILDCMAYYSYHDVLPVYYETLCYKSLRDEDSIDMLEIITDTRAADLGRCYGWSLYLLEELGKAVLNKGDLNTASIVASYETTVNANIQQSLDAMNTGK